MDEQSAYYNDLRMHRSLLYVRHMVRGLSPFLDPEDMQAGLDRAAELMADASRLTNFLACGSIKEL